MINETNNVFKTPFSVRYWKEACGELKKTKMLVVTALFIALKISMSYLFIPIPGINGQRISISFFVVALTSMVCGPVLGGMAGMISDLIGAHLFPTGPFFFGYTITATVSSFIYGLFFYRAKISVTRIFICKLLVNMLAHVGLNSLWRAMITNVDFTTIAILNLPKNIIMLPIETFLLYLFFKALAPILKRENLIKI